MRIAQLRNRVALQTGTDSKDGSGVPEQSWATTTTRWAEVRPLRGVEAFQAAQLNADVDHMVTMRYDATVGAATPKNRLLWGSRAFDILSVVNVDERDEWLEFLVREAV